MTSSRRPNQKNAEAEEEVVVEAGHVEEPDEEQVAEVVVLWVVEEDPEDVEELEEMMIVSSLIFLVKLKLQTGKSARNLRILTIFFLALIFHIFSREIEVGTIFQV